MEAARRGLERYDVCSSEIIAACAFLARRWWDWNSEGRPLITQAYKIYLAAAVRMLKMTTDMTFDDIKEAVGHQGNSSIPTLDVIWPDWAHEQKERLSRTLQSAVMTDGPGAISAEEIAAFANFIDQEHQDALFLRLHSFERHAFQDLDSPIAGMLSDLQGMAVTIEHVIRVLIGSDIGGKDQLYDLFLKLWTGSVEKILTGGNTLARQGLLKFGPGTLSFGWLDVKAKIEKLRSSGTTEAVVADLLMAHRLRGAVHYQLPENDQFEIEGLFVGLLRAAAMTHAHVQRQKRVDVAASNAIKAPGGDVRDIEPPAEETDSRQHGQ